METVLGGFSATEVTKEGVRKPEPKSDEDLQRIVSEKIRKRKRKKPGNLAKTLDSTLEPRLPPGRPGRPKGSHNYEWTPEKDRRLKELCERYGPAKAKGIMQKELLGSGEFKSRPDSVRNAVERRMLYLGLATGQERIQRAQCSGAPNALLGLGHRTGAQVAKVQKRKNLALIRSQSATGHCWRKFARRVNRGSYRSHHQGGPGKACQARLRSL